MNPSDFFALVKVRPSLLGEQLVALVYDSGGDLWSAQVVRQGQRYSAIGRTVGEVFDILMHGLRRRDLVDDTTPSPDPGT